ncbi:PTS lactose/cellobiose transporter subunit IIA (plasmid) [Clostridium perfringens]
MREEDILMSMEIIAGAGEARSIAVLAVEEAKKGNIEEARKMIGQAKEAMDGAHNAQTKLITQEMNGDPVAINVLLIHSQDHLMTTIAYHQSAESLIDLWEVVHKLNK